MANTTRRIAVATGLMVVGTGAEFPALGGSAEPGRSVVLKVLVDDDVRVPAEVLAQARNETARVFDHIDVDVVWLDPRAVQRDDAAALRSVIVLHVISREMT